MKNNSVFSWMVLFVVIGGTLFIPKLANIQVILSIDAAIDATPLFSVKLINVQMGPVIPRTDCSYVMEGELPKIGINAELELIGSAAFSSRCTHAEVGAYDEGGYDIAFLSFSPSTGHPGAFMQGVYGTAAIPPAGFNVMYWAPGTDSFGRRYLNYRANESNQLIEKINSNWNLTEVKEDIKTWQEIWYDVMPNVLIYNQYDVHAISTGLYGYDPVPREITFINPFSCLESIWTTNDYPGTPREVVLASSTAGASFNTLIATDVYDQYSAVPAMDALLGFTPSKELILPLGINRSQWMLDNFGTIEHLQLYPRVADTLGIFSANGLQYNISIRDDVLWHDGHILDAWDVAFSFQAQMIPYKYSNGRPRYYSWFYGGLSRPFGNDDKQNHHGNYSFVVEDRDSNDFYEHISFQLNQTCGEFEMDYLISPLLPEHILGDPINHGFNESGNFNPSNQWLVPINEWESHSYNTASPSDLGGYKGPIGCGSMIYKQNDPDSGTITLEKFENIRWDNSSKTWVNDTLTNHFLIKDGKLLQMPTEATILVASMDSAFTDMKTGEVNIMDPQFTMANIIDEIEAETTVQPILSVGNSLRGMFFNPKFEQDGVYHLNKKGVRHAISHIVPRQSIIENRLSGLGCPAYSPLPRNGWAALPQEDLIEYKRLITASDGSTPVSEETTAYDSYNKTLALNWLETEGYDVSFWRNNQKYSTQVTEGEPLGTLILFLVVIVSGGGIGLALLIERIRRTK